MTPAEFLEQKLGAASARFEQSVGAPCQYDRDAVVWLDAQLRALRDESKEQRAELVSELGAFLGQCFVETFQGQWARVNEGGLAVKLGDNVFVVPWDKVEGFLSGDEGDSPLGFFDFIGNNYVGKSFDNAKFLF